LHTLRPKSEEEAKGGLHYRGSVSGTNSLACRGKRASQPIAKQLDINGCLFPRRFDLFFLIISKRFHSIQKCYHRIMVRAPINPREFFLAIFKVNVKKKKGEDNL